MKNKITLVAVIAAMLVIISSCSAAPKDFNIAFVIGNGPADSRQVKEVVMPGERVTKERDDIVEYVYSNPRNWANGEGREGADWGQDFTATSKASDDGSVPGYPVKMQQITYFALNRDPDALKAFYPYCKKYFCDIDPDIDPETQDMSSDPGWNTMLSEGLKNAILLAYNEVIAQYDVSIVNQPERWNEIETKMQPIVMDELRAAAGMNKMDPFCSTAVTNGGKCEPITINIQKLSSPDADVILKTRRDQENNTRNTLAQIAADAEVQKQQAALEAQKARDAQALYANPSYAAERAYAAYLEQIKACNGKCIVTIGGEQNLQLQEPVG